jgi:beta-1,4-mannosyl-glycoprotein beta-1,4-N-acetylglucosaminyltransferase
MRSAFIYPVLIFIFIKVLLIFENSHFQKLISNQLEAVPDVPQVNIPLFSELRFVTAPPGQASQKKLKQSSSTCFRYEKFEQRQQSSINVEFRQGSRITNANGLHFDLIQPRKVWDMFLFNNELDMLAIRLHELWPVVDKFVLVESKQTLVGQAKELYFQNNKSRFHEFIGKIEHIVLDSGDEHAMRFALTNHAQSAQPDDILILSDVDEIPRCSVIAELRNLREFPKHTYVLLKMSFFYYSYRWIKSNSDRLHQIHSQTTSKAISKDLLSRFDLARINRMHQTPAEHFFVDNAGWHCSFCFSAEMIRSKIQSFAHQEYNRPPFTNLDHINSVIRSGKDLFLRNGEDLVLNNNSIIPSLVLTQHSKYSRFYPNY